MWRADPSKLCFDLVGAIALLETRWGRLKVWEDYEDCERVAAWDKANLRSVSA